MTGYEMLSESQERVLMVLQPGREDEAAEIFTAGGLILPLSVVLAPIAWKSCMRAR